MNAHQRAEHLFKEAERLGCDTPTEAMTADAFSDMEFNHQQEIQSLTRRLEEVTKERDAMRSNWDVTTGMLQQSRKQLDGATSKLTALRTVAEAARDALADMIRGAQKQNWQDNYPQEINAAYKALAALRAELDQADSNASNSPTASRESHG